MKHTKYTVIGGGTLLAVGLSLVMAVPIVFGQQEADEEPPPYEQSEEGAEKIGAEFNPGDIDVEHGHDLFRAAGANGKSCASCHGDNGEGLIGAAARYPMVVSRKEGVRNLELQINQCRTQRMDSEPYEWSAQQFTNLSHMGDYVDSRTDMRNMLLYVKSRSNGIPINIKTDGIAHEYWEKGKRFYWSKRGQRNLSCANCHVMNDGKRLGPVRLSSPRGQAAKFPVYTIATDAVETLQFRYQTCSRDVRAHILDINTEPALNLELYHNSLSNGMPYRAPGFSL